MDQYLTSLNEVESRLIASEKWIDVPLKKQDYSHLNLDATTEGEPAEYYRDMFDLIALAFDADITRSVAFMLNREDGMGISDTFPLKLGPVARRTTISRTPTDKDGQLDFAKYDLFLSQQTGAFPRPTRRSTRTATAACSTTRSCCSAAARARRTTRRTCRRSIAGGANMGLKHGTYWRKDDDADVEHVPQHSAVAGHRAGVVRRQHRHAERVDFYPRVRSDAVRI